MSLTFEQTSAVLARLNDRRTIDEFEIGSWMQVLNTDPELTVDEAMAAVVTYLATSTEFAKPAHILALVKQARRARRTADTDAEICQRRGPKFAVDGYCAICGVHQDEHPAAA